tara:strand:- start:1452 stop:1634 length:183 start_codon:yes stop_codon:yes gene_type:complete
MEAAIAVVIGMLGGYYIGLTTAQKILEKQLINNKLMYKQQLEDRDARLSMVKLLVKLEEE